MHCHVVCFASEAAQQLKALLASILHLAKQVSAAQQIFKDNSMPYVLHPLPVLQLVIHPRYDCSGCNLPTAIIPRCQDTIRE